MQTQNILLVILSIWTTVLTGLLIYTFIIMKKLSDKADKGNIVKLLKNLIDKQSKNTKDIKNIFKSIEGIQEENLLNTQKVSLVKYNPYNELGGKHSFSLVMLDGNDDGILITVLHARDRTRVYAKNVKNGKTKLDLSKEEIKALTKARNGRK